MNRHAGIGRISVSVPGFEHPELGPDAAVGVPVEVLDKRLRLQQRTRSERDVEIGAGTYVVAITLPDGSRHTDVVEVRTGETTRVELEWSRAPVDDVKARAKSRTGAKALLKPAPNSFYLRFIDVGGDLEPVAADERLQKVLDDYSRQEGVFATALSIHAPPEPHRVHFAEVFAEGLDPVAVALPVASVGEAGTCLLNVAISAERLEVDVRMQGTPEADAISQFMASAQLVEAAAVPEAAEAMLYRKLRHPFGAALGGYALLRLNELERLHDWPQNLASWFDWLPDGHIILGELSLRRKDVTEAFAAFRRALDRGLPVFTDGFSILQARLRSLAAGKAVKDLPQRTRSEARGALEALNGWTPWVRFDAVHTTLQRRGHRPAITNSGGWQRFRPPFARRGEASDFWSDP